MNKKIKLRRPYDPTIPIVALALSVFGLVMILSSSQIQAVQDYGNSYHFFIRQLLWWLGGVIAFFYFLKLPLESLYENRLNFLFASLILLVLVFVPILGPEIAGVHRWISLGFLQFQPAEIVKLLLIIYLAGWFAAKGELIEHPVKGTLPFLAVLALVTGLIVIEPDMGTAFVIILSAMVMFFVANANIWQYAALVVLGAIAVILLIYAAPYRAARLTGFLDRENQQQESGYHVNQALIAIGSGGLWGVGFGQGTSKYAYLPESHTDSIFAVIGEELGFVRGSLVVLAYFYLLWRGFVIARYSNSRFVQLLVVGLTTTIVSQAVINISGMLGLIPLTGVPLPLVSYGGSSLVVTMAMLGLLTNASRERS